MNSSRPTIPHSWKHFKREAFEQLRRDLAVAFELMEGGRLRAELRMLRRRHHILVIADRLQQSATEKGEALSPNLMAAAELVFEKRGHTRRNANSDTRTAEEERYLGSARVRWHKLLKDMEKTPTSSASGRASKGAGSAPSTEGTHPRTDEASLDAILRVIESAAATSLVLSSQLRTLAHQLRPLVLQVAPPERAEGGEQPE